MTRGGARNRSGPQADPSSERSERRGYSLTALPAEGFDGPVPPWPLPRRDVIEKTPDGPQVDMAATRLVEAREAELWEWAWSTPQACAWSMPSESWRLHTIAMWVRTFVLCESSVATAADKGSLHRFADQIGLTPAGLAENGWKIKVDELGARRAEHEAAQTPAELTVKRERRLRAT